MTNEPSPDHPSKPTSTLRLPLTTRSCRNTPCDWLSDPNQPVRGEQALWVAVITQAMMDALSRAGSNEARYHKNEAVNWLTGNGRDFVTVCLQAGLDPNYVRRKAKRTLLNPQNWRADAGKGRRYEERKAYRKRKQLEKQSAPAAAAAEEAHVICGHWHY